MVFAHSVNDTGRRHELGDHLRAVADAAAMFAESFGGAELARWAGLAHDAGKASQQFQEYLAACERDPHRKHPTTDHKGLGTLLAVEGNDLGLAALIRGHHGGLPDDGELRSKARELESDQRVAATRVRAQALGLLPPSPHEINYPAFANDPLGNEFFLRMLFSALVDADHRDTERHFEPARSATREPTRDLGMLAARLEAAQAHITGTKTDPVNVARDQVWQACLAKATQVPGFFRLTVPTGGGKTLSGLRFALRHAIAHGMARVIVAVPYLTITEQTVDVYRRVLGDDRVVLEHHSAAGTRDDEAGAATPAETWRRLAAQDWDAPVVVTTTVQLFESLFGRATTSCRKLHRLARSVIVLDEVQALPTDLLQPILDGLQQLVTHYRSSVVFSTATQPAYEAALRRAQFQDIASHEIAPNPPHLFRSLKRVDYEWPGPGVQLTWEEVADAMQDEPRALAIVNTKRDALSLLDALDDPSALHLSTLLCGAHRRAALAEVRARLSGDSACRLVSTQVVEAGVDIDFPFVLRAIGPLDRIVQAAGRCNREGKLAVGRVMVFDPAEGGLPPGTYRTATDVTKMLLAAGPIDPDDPATFEQYFSRLFQIAQMARGEEVQRLRQRLAYEQVATEFRMIEPTVSLLVPYAGPEGGRHRWSEATAAMDLRHEFERAANRPRPGTGRVLMRRAQPYLVGIRQRVIEGYASSGLATALVGDVWAWEGKYDPVRGVVEDGKEADELVI